MEIEVHAGVEESGENAHGLLRQAVSCETETD